ncbi:MAG: MFS transporter [Cyanobacteria bacterium P01_B01_bin.77]
MDSISPAPAKRIQKLGLLGGLYISQLIPLAFLGQAVPVYLRQQGVSLQNLGLLSLLGLPWMLKFLWAPLIDRYGFTPMGHYRFWIICFQLLAAMGTAAVGFIDLQHGLMLAILGGLVFFVCASQDVATDALAVGLLSPQERGWGNGVQTAGNYLGIVIGGGGMLLLLEHWGWRSSLWLMAAMLLVALLPVLGHRESYLQPADSTHQLTLKHYWQTFVAFFRRPGMGLWLLTMMAYTAGSYMILGMFRPLLVDIGFSLADIGLLLGIVGSLAGMVGAIMAGSVVAALGRKRSLVIFGLLRSVVLLAYLLPVFGWTQVSLIYGVVISAQIAISMANTTLYTIMMDNSEPTSAGTDYTLQNSMIAVNTTVVSIISGILADAWGYGVLFAIAIAISFSSVAIIGVSFQSAAES